MPRALVCGVSGHLDSMNARTHLTSAARWPSQSESRWSHSRAVSSETRGPGNVPITLKQTKQSRNQHALVQAEDGRSAINSGMRVLCVAAPRGPGTGPRITALSSNQTLLVSSRGSAGRGVTQMERL